MADQEQEQWQGVWEFSIRLQTEQIMMMVKQMHTASDHEEDS